MAEKDKKEDLVEIFIDTIEKPADVTLGEPDRVKLLLQEAKGNLGAENARFRLRSWDDRSVVYVPKWIMGSELEEAEPELAERVYFDNGKNQEAEDTENQELRIDCKVGLMARQARIEEEELRGEEADQILLTKLKEGLQYNNGEKIWRFEDLIRKRV